MYNAQGIEEEHLLFVNKYFLFFFYVFSITSQTFCDELAKKYKQFFYSSKIKKKKKLVRAIIRFFLFHFFFCS